VICDVYAYALAAAKGLRELAAGSVSCLCRAQLSFNTDRCVRKLMDAECFKCYKDRLFDPDVYQFFTNILKQMKKCVVKASTELREQVDEWEKKIDALHHAQADDHDAATRAAANSTRAAHIPLPEVAEAGEPVAVTTDDILASSAVPPR
jgi:hypothetical protein